MFGMDCANFYFWQGFCENKKIAVKITFGSWHTETRVIHTGFNISGSEQRLWQNFGKIKVGMIPDKKKLANTIFSAFCTYTLSLILYRATLTIHTKKHTHQKASHPSHSHIRHNTYHTTPHINTSRPSPTPEWPP